LADTQIPSLNGFNEYVDIVNSTSQPNLSDDILNGSLKESVESSLDSLRELVSSLQINAATDISKVKNMMEERVNNLNGILNQFKDANIKERYQEELKEITKELEADLAKLIEEKQDIQEVNSMLPSWSKVPFTLQEQTAIFALYEQSDESTQKLYNEYIKGEDLEDKYLEFYMNFLSRLDDSTQTKFDKC
jgi:flagellar motility protein MotE (MotC chaperone)